MCDQKNIDLKALLKHVNQYHANVKSSVVGQRHTLAYTIFTVIPFGFAHS